VSSKSKQLVISSLEELIRGFNDLSGFLGAGVFAPDGRLIVSHCLFGLLVDRVGPELNGLFIDAVALLERLELGRGRFSQIQTDQVNILLYSYNEGSSAVVAEDGKLHFHTVLLLEQDSSVGMAKLKLKKFVRAAAMLLSDAAV
jgi:predicted regulator of Ras-like GTPase activity (Roadblock/LC7/MglB family)